MSNIVFRVPRQTDAALLEAFKAIQIGMRELVPELAIRVLPHHGASQIQLPPEDETAPELVRSIIGEGSEIMPEVSLRDTRNGHNALTLNREFNTPSDRVTCYWEPWATNTNEAIRSRAFIRLQSLARKHLRASDNDASLAGLNDTEWGQYRAAQLHVIQSLEEVQRQLTVEFSQRMAEADKAASERQARLETDLREQLAQKQSMLESEHQARLDQLTKREQLLADKEAGFNTKEGRYVARQQQVDQMKALQERLKDWSLTDATQQKRWWVKGGCLAALAFTAWLTWEFNSQNYTMLMSDSIKGDISKVQWWQWMMLALRSLLPAASFIAFVVYYIRWSASWARQHAEEEFNTHARVLDVGRSAWLLEAVRDAQDHQQEIPESLLKELSRNLFVYQTSSDSGELSPRLPHEALLQGLASLRLKTSDGSEIEMTKGKKAKTQ